MATIIDNDNTAVTYAWAIGGDGTFIRRVAQSFTLADTETIASIKFRAGLNTGSAFDMTVTVETDSAGVPSGTLADANLTTTVTGESGTGSTQYTATFTSTSLASGTYWIVIKKVSESTADNNYNIWSSTTASTYAGGIEASYAGSYTTRVNDDMYFQVISPDSSGILTFF